MAIWIRKIIQTVGKVELAMLVVKFINFGIIFKNLKYMLKT
jgi:hypothetical protein